MPIPFADNFLAGSLLSLLLPIAPDRDRRLVRARRSPRPEREPVTGHRRRPRIR